MLDKEVTTLFKPLTQKDSYCQVSQFILHLAKCPACLVWLLPFGHNSLVQCILRFNYSDRRGISNWYFPLLSHSSHHLLHFCLGSNHWTQCPQSLPSYSTIHALTVLMWPLLTLNKLIMKCLMDKLIVCLF